MNDTNPMAAYDEKVFTIRLRLPYLSTTPLASLPWQLLPPFERWDCTPGSSIPICLERLAQVESEP